MLSVLKSRRWLEKATFTTSDLSGAGGGLLVPDQVETFIRVAMQPRAILGKARTEFSRANKFKVSRISFHGVRVLTAGVEATALGATLQKKGATGEVELSTALFKGAVPMSDETFEDNIEREGFWDTYMQQVGEAVGRDLEEIAIKSDTARIPGDNDPEAGNEVFDKIDGIVKHLEGAAVPAAQVYDAAGQGDVETILKKLLELMPARYRQDPSQITAFVPVKVGDAWADALSARGTNLGDETLVGGKLRTYRGMNIQPVPLFEGTGTVNSVAKFYDRYAFATASKNLIAGFHRRVQIEKWRQPLEGTRYIIPSVRFDVKFAIPDFVTVAKNIDSIG